MRCSRDLFDIQPPRREAAVLLMTMIIVSVIMIIRSSVASIADDVADCAGLKNVDEIALHLLWFLNGPCSEAGTGYWTELLVVMMMMMMISIRGLVKWSRKNFLQTNLERKRLECRFVWFWYVGYFALWGLAAVLPSTIRFVLFRAFASCVHWIMMVMRGYLSI